MKVTILDDYQCVFAGLAAIERLRQKAEVQILTEKLNSETHIEVASSEAPDKIRHLIKMGEQTCFTLQSLINPVPVKTSVTLNGGQLALYK